MSLIDKRLAADVLDTALATGGDFAEIFVENSQADVIKMSELQVKNISSSLVSGVGVRIFSGAFQTYAYTNIIEKDNLLRIAKQAALVIKNEQKTQRLDFRNLEFVNLSNIKIDTLGVPKQSRIDFLYEISNQAYVHNKLVNKVNAALRCNKRNILIANSEGVWAEDTQMYTGILFSVQAMRDNIREETVSVHKNMQGYELIENFPCGKEEFVLGTVDRAIAKTYADYCPSGVMPVILANGKGGVIFHEACGHSLEVNKVANCASEFGGKIGQVVASPLVSAYDDGCIANANGSANFDDEGTPNQRRLLIENGVLKNYLTDRFYGRKLGLRSNGACRRQDYTYIPTPRMSNTFIANGSSKKDDMIASIDYGLYAKRLSGGSVNPTTGEFNFAVEEGYIVRNGKIAEQVKGAKLIGKGIDVLKKIDMVGNDMELSGGTCGSGSGSIPVTIGQPTIRISEMIVGGHK